MKTRGLKIRKKDPDEGEVSFWDVWDDGSPSGRLLM